MAGGILTVRRNPTDASALAIGGKFKRFGPEKERAVGKAEIKEDETLKQLKDIYAWLRQPAICKLDCDVVPIALDALKGVAYSAADVADFSIALAEFQEDNFSFYAGRFLSALIANGKDEEFIIPTMHLSVPLEGLGTGNTKRIIVEGPGGVALGYEMRSGSIEVRGDVDHWCGQGMDGGSIAVYGNAGGAAGLCMSGGTITILGDAGGEVGTSMRGGLIIVKGNVTEKAGAYMHGGTIRISGNAGELVGEYMHGGEIIIKGNIKSLGEEIRGKIYISKGRLIIEK
jgi:hypothetical protein